MLEIISSLALEIVHLSWDGTSGSLVQLGSNVSRAHVVKALRFPNGVEPLICLSRKRKE